MFWLSFTGTTSEKLDFGVIDSIFSVDSNDDYDIGYEGSGIEDFGNKESEFDGSGHEGSDSNGMV